MILTFLTRTCARLSPHRLASLCSKSGCRLLFAALSDHELRRLRRSGILHEDSFSPSSVATVRAFIDLNDAVEFVEDELLLRYRFDGSTEYSRGLVAADSSPPPGTVGLEEGLAALLGEMCEAPGRLAQYFRRAEIRSGTVLWCSGDEPNMTCFLESGRLGVLSAGDSKGVCLVTRTNGGGLYGALEENSVAPSMAVVDAAVAAGDHSVFADFTVPGQLSGELTLFTGESRRNTVVAIEDSVVWCLSVSDLVTMRQQAPDLVGVLSTLALRYASHRLNHLALEGHVHSV